MKWKRRSNTVSVGNGTGADARIEPERSPAGGCQGCRKLGRSPLSIMDDDQCWTFCQRRWSGLSVDQAVSLSCGPNLLTHYQRRHRCTPSVFGWTTSSNFGPPLATPTMAGRKTRSPILYSLPEPPGRRNCWALPGSAFQTWLDGSSGSNFSPSGLNLLTPALVIRLQQFALGEFNSFDQRLESRLNRIHVFRQERPGSPAADCHLPPTGHGQNWPLHRIGRRSFPALFFCAGCPFPRSSAMCGLSFPRFRP